MRLRTIPWGQRDRTTVKAVALCAADQSLILSTTYKQPNTTTTTSPEHIYMSRLSGTPPKEQLHENIMRKQFYFCGRSHSVVLEYHSLFKAGSEG